MVVDIAGKIALITGGAQGLGFNFAKEFLKHGLKGLAITDINTEKGEEAVKKLNEEFGATSAIFIKANVIDMKELEGAFKKTVEVFKHIDILINNAGISDEQNWELLVNINIKGVIHGMLLGLDNYLRKFKSTSEALIINVCSVASLIQYQSHPIYGLSKYAVMGMVRSWGTPRHFERTGVKVIGICPGFTHTRMIQPSGAKYIGPEYKKMEEEIMKEYRRIQSPEHVAKELIMITAKADNGSLWVVEFEEPAYEYHLPPKDVYKPHPQLSNCSN